LHVDVGYFILTLYEKRVDEKDLPFFLGLMEHLAGHGLNCPQPVRNRHGGALGRIAGRPAAIVTFLDGMWRRSPSVHCCAAVGEALGKLHLAGAAFALYRSNALALQPGWPYLDEGMPRVQMKAAGLAAEIAASWPISPKLAARFAERRHLC
jgi:homoserine kinase type II